MARIAHLDVDAFYVAVHLKQQPDLAGRPVVVAGTRARSVVTTASYEARRYGIRSGIPSSRARQLCPEATFIAPDMPLYRQASQLLWADVTTALPGSPFEQVSVDEAYLDLTTHPTPVTALQNIVEQTLDKHGLQLSVGLGPNRVVAKIASDADKPAGFTVLSREQAYERFAEASPRLVPGIGPKTTERLAAIGLTTLRQLADADVTMLARHFGDRAAEELQNRAHLHGPEQLATERVRKSRSAEITFEYDISDLDELREYLTTLSRRVAEDLAQRGQQGATVGIKVRLADFTTFTRDQTLARPTRDAHHIEQVARDLFDAAAPSEPVRLLGVRVSGLDRTPPPQLLLFE